MRARLARQRVAPEVFELPVERIRDGSYTDAYFNHARPTLLADGCNPSVLMQVFQRKEAVPGGMDEALAVLRLCSHDWDARSVATGPRSCSCAHDSALAKRVS